MVNEAAIMAVKDGRQVVSQKDLFEAVEVVLAGKEKKDRILGQEEKEIVSYHEIGHALVATLLKNTEPVQKITYRSPYYGCPWLCNAGAGRRKVSDEKGRVDRGDHYPVRRPCSRRDQF